MNSNIINTNDYYICNNKVIYYSDKFDPEKHLKIIPLSKEDFKNQQKYKLYSVLISNTISNDINKYNQNVYIYIPPSQIYDYYDNPNDFNIINEYNKPKFNITSFQNIYKIYNDIYFKVSKFVIYHFKDIFKDKNIINEHYFNNAFNLDIIKSENRTIPLNPKCSINNLSNQDIFKVSNNSIIKFNITNKDDFKDFYNVPISLIINISKIWLTKPRQKYKFDINNFTNNFITFYGIKPFIQQIIIDERPMIPNQQVNYIHKDALVISKLFYNNKYNYNIINKEDYNLDELLKININKSSIYKTYTSWLSCFYIFEKLFFNNINKYGKDIDHLPQYTEIDFDNNIIKYNYNKLIHNVKIISLDQYVKQKKQKPNIEKPLKKKIIYKNK